MPKTISTAAKDTAANDTKAVAFDLPLGKAAVHDAETGDSSAPGIADEIDLQAGLLSRTDVINILTFYFGPIVGSSQFAARVNVADTCYLPAPPKPIVRSIELDPVLAPECYVNDVFDCDDYVMYLKTRMSLLAQQKKAPAPFAVGYLLTNEHAFNFCISAESLLWLIDTQSASHAIEADKLRFRSFLGLNASNHVLFIYI